MVLFASVGMIGGYFTGCGNPVEIISITLGGNFMLLGLLIILLAQLSTNVAANLYAAGNIIEHLSDGRLDFSKAVIVGGVAGMFTFPWLLLDYFLVYLPIIGATLAPLPGLMIVDYYLLHRGKIDLSKLADDKKIASFFQEINFNAIIAYIIAGAVSTYFLQYSWLVSMPVAMILYYALMKVKEHKGTID